MQLYGKNNKSLAKAVYIDDIDDDFIIIDIRQPDEIQDARIKDIMYLNDDVEIKKIADSNKDKKILLHCGIGYRAAIMGTRLVQLGCKNIYFFDDSFSKFYKKFEIIGDNA